MLGIITWQKTILEGMKTMKLESSFLIILRWACQAIVSNNKIMTQKLCALAEIRLQMKKSYT
jgi:hypothetical protein